MDKSIWTADLQRLCTRLRELRTKAGLLQVELAAMLGASQSYVTKYERGETRLDLFQLRAVCRALGISLSALVAEFD